MDALRTMVSARFKKMTAYMATREVPYFFGLLNLAASAALPVVILSKVAVKNRDDSQKEENPEPEIITAYCLFVVSAVLSLMLLTWAGAYMSTESNFRRNMMESRVFRLIMKNYFFVECLCLALSIGTLSVEGEKYLLQIIGLDGVCCVVMLVVYVSVIYAGRVLRTGYEGAVLTAVLSVGFTFATKMASNVNEKVGIAIVIVAALIEILLVIWADFVLPEEPLLKDAQLRAVLIRAANIAFARNARQQQTAFLNDVNQAIAATGQNAHLAFNSRLNGARTELRDAAKTYYEERAAQAFNAVAPDQLAHFTRTAREAQEDRRAGRGGHVLLNQPGDLASDDEELEIIQPGD